MRAARRPQGWTPSGPPPAAPPERPEVWPGPGEDLCYLSGDWRILQRAGGHRWSLDDLVTAWFAAEQFSDSFPARIADLGCGIGAVLLLLAWRFPQAKCTGVEAQAASAELAQRSAGWNGVENRCEVRLGDLRDPALVPEADVYDLVTGTPPYLPPGTAVEPRRLQQAGCHIEMRGGIEEYCRAAARLMRPGGVFAVCHAAAQAQRAATAAVDAGLAIQSAVEVIPRAGKAALFSVYAMRHAMEVPGPPASSHLVVRDECGQRTEEFGALRRRMGMPP